MKDLSSARGWEYAYLKALKEKVERLRTGLEGGDNRRETDLETFHYICGQIRGIRDCITDLTEVRDRFNVDADKDLELENV